MENCFQTSGQNMLQHGQSVAHESLKLIKNNTIIPIAIYDNIVEHFSHEISISDLILYWTYHDCGKHLCLKIDEVGHRHYPNHAEISSQQFSKIWPDKLNVIELIRRDMDFHILRADDLTNLWNHPLANILYLTAWAELEANAKMFGGHDSDSYKIKRKHLIKAFNRKEKK